MIKSDIIDRAWIEVRVTRERKVKSIEDLHKF